MPAPTIAAVTREIGAAPDSEEAWRRRGDVDPARPRRWVRPCFAGGAEGRRRARRSRGRPRGTRTHLADLRAWCQGRRATAWHRQPRLLGYSLMASRSLQSSRAAVWTLRQ